MRAPNLEPLRDLLDAVLPERRRAPKLEDDAPAIHEAFWTRIGESDLLAPRGLGRAALAGKVASVFAEWLERPSLRAAWGELNEDGIPRQLSTKIRWLPARADRIILVDESGDDLDPPVERITDRSPDRELLGRPYSEQLVDQVLERIPIEHQASFFFGTALDDARTPVLDFYARLHSLGPGVWTFGSRRPNRPSSRRSAGWLRGWRGAT